jgi:tetratricopeptide (TPR) repeat protein
MKRSHAMLAILVAMIFALSSCGNVQTSGAKVPMVEKAGTTSGAQTPTIGKGSFEKAVDVAMAAVQKNPNDANAHFQLGVAYSNVDDVGKAYLEFIAADKLNPKKTGDAEAAISSNFQKHYESGISSFQAGDSRGAAHEFDLAAKADPRQVKAWLNLGKADYAMADKDSTYMQKAYDVVDTLLVRNKKPDDPNYTGALAFEGRLLAKQGKDAEAVKTIGELLKRDPNEFKVAEGAAIEYLNKKNWKPAFDLLTLATDARAKTNQEAFDPCYNLGAACLSMKDFPHAIDAFSDAVRIDPENKKGRYFLLLAYYQGEQFDDAILSGEEYTKKYPDDSNGWRILSLSYAKKGMTIKAEEAAKKALEVAQ